MKLEDFERDAFGRIVIRQNTSNPEYLTSNTDRIKFFFGDDDRHFFKGENFVTYSDYEIFISYLAKEVGLEAVKYYPAVFIQNDGKQILGVVSDDFTQDKSSVRLKSKTIDEATLHLGNTLENHILQLSIYADILEKEQNINLIYNEREIKKQLTDLIVFDVFTLQRDRERRNIEYLIEKDGNEWHLRLAPIFDNSMVFGTESNDMLGLIEEKIEFNEALPPDTFENKDFLFGMKDKMTFGKLVAEIENNYLLNPNIMLLVQKFRKIDYSKIKSEIKKDNPDYDFPDDVIEIAQKVLEYTLTAGKYFKRKGANLDKHFC